MRAGKRDAVPARLSRLQHRFAAWRKSRKPGERIPKRLWNSAAKLAAIYGVSQTAKVLKLDYYSLKRQLDQQPEVSASKSAFVELPPPPLPLASECIIEFEDGEGASMRFHLKGTEVPDVLALGSSFWNAK